MLGSGSIVFLIFFLDNNFQYGQCLSRIDPLVDTKVGLIRGLKADDGDYGMFLGIPYGQIDEANPFGKSTPQPKFTEVFEAYDDSAICPQVFQLNGTIVGTADCLRLNVYVPTSATSKNRLPVMVWIYGGSFRRGYFARYFYGPSYLVKQDVILVTFNYRVGAYGFMCLDIPEVPGNQGLKDQLLAMQWIKDNIEAFGGDPEKITLFGESAGGHSVDLHLLSQKEKLYNKVIIQSGSSLASTVLFEPDKSAPLKIADHLGFNTTDTDKAITFLAETDPILVVEAAIQKNIIFKPCIETEFDGVEPFLSSSWLNAEVPKVKNMPVLIGFNENELTASHYGQDAEYYENLSIVTDYLNQIFDFNDEEFEEMERLISHYYFGDEGISEKVKWDLIKFDSDFTYIHSIQRTIKKYLDSGAGSIYYYMFSYVGGRNAIIVDDDEDNLESSPCCASHADELGYLFDMGFKPELTAKDEIIVERMTKMWTNFAKYNDPTPETTDLLPVKWVPLTADTYTYMDIGSELSLGSRPVHDRMAFWHLFYKLNEKRQKNYEDKHNVNMSK